MIRKHTPPDSGTLAALWHVALRKPTHHHVGACRCEGALAFAEIRLPLLGRSGMANTSGGLQCLTKYSVQTVGDSERKR